MSPAEIALRSPAALPDGPRNVAPSPPPPADAGRPSGGPRNVALSSRPVPVLRVLPLAALRLSPRNPRPDPGADLAALAASFGAPTDPFLVQEPGVEALPDGTYRVIYGARRVLAAQAAGVTHLRCKVYHPLDPLIAFELSVRENLHHQALTPFALATTVKLLNLLDNAVALGLESEAHPILAADTAPAAKLAPLLALLAAAGWQAKHPAVPAQESLNRRGIALDAATRRRLMELIKVDPALQPRIAALDLTLAATVALARLPAAPRADLVATLEREPALKPRVRRISRVVRQKGYTLPEALAEARGAPPALAEDAAGTPAPETPAAPAALSAAGQAAISELLTLANHLPHLLASLQAEAGPGGLATLPAPWGDYATSALQLLRTQLAAEV